jgi:hypothetical protein
VDDRRKYPRIATDQVISFALLDARDQLGVSKNLSAGGIRFEAVGCELDLGDTIRVTFNVGEQTVVAVGQVTWATEIDPLTLDIGLIFLEVDPEALRLLEEFEARALRAARLPSRRTRASVHGHGGLPPDRGDQHPASPRAAGPRSARA